MGLPRLIVLLNDTAVEEVILRLHSYVVARDYGFAPNPFHGYCTLATCKPEIRRTAKIGDWIVGTGSKVREREGRLVYAMEVREVMTFDEYWDDPRFNDKRPNMRGSKKQAFGDNIYHHGRKGWQQEDSHHSLTNGTPNARNIANDTQTNRVLVSDKFVYFGGHGPEIPKCFRDFQGHDICGRRGHKNQFPEKMVEEFAAWVTSLGQTGYCGTPLDWPSSA